MEDRKDEFHTRLRAQKENSVSTTRGPLFCDVLITERCNLRCRKCYFWKNGEGDGLSLDEYKKFILSLKDIVKPPFEINLGGGEPLLRKDIFELIKFCAQCGLQPAMSTNATLISDETALQLADSGLQRLSISLESLDEDTHDFIVNTPGAYKRLMRGIEHLKKHWRKGFINIHCVIAQQNLSGIPELVEWVNKDKFFTGVAFQALSQPFRTSMIDQWYLNEEYGQLWPKDQTRVSSTLDMLIKYKRDGYKIVNPESQLAVYKKYYSNPDAFARAFHCNFGEYIFNVNILGLVHLCCFMRPIGNIKDKSIKELWFSGEGEEMRRLMLNCQKSCNNILNCYFQEEKEEGAV